MDQINRFLDFISPAAKRRRTTLGPTTTSNDVEGSEDVYAPPSAPHDRKALERAKKRVNKKYLSPSDTKTRKKNIRKRDRDTYEQDNESNPGEHDDDDDDADALKSPDHDTDEDYQDQQSVGEDEDAEPDLTEEKETESLNRQAELALRIQEIQAVRNGERGGKWHKDEEFLFERLAMRSYEPLLPSDWRIDFGTFPEDLFTGKTKEALINYNFASSYRGVRALQSLVTLGARVKEKYEIYLPAEKLMAKEIKNYIKWAETDGDYANSRFIPVITALAAHPGDKYDVIHKAIVDQLRFLALQHRQALSLPPPGRVNAKGEVVLYSRRPPLLYGIMCAKTMAFIVTLDSADSKSEGRFITHFDFKELGKDVWNGLAIAIVVMCARNYMMSIKDELQPEDEGSSDPDA